MMKRLVTCGLLAVWTAITVWAAPAMREPFLATQPDGTTVEIMLHGDEHAAWSTTADGVLVVERNKAYYVAAVDAQGRLSATTLLAHQPMERSTQELQACKAQQQQQRLFFEQCELKQQKGRRAQVTSTSYFPHTGSPKCLVILVNFSDVRFTSGAAQAQFDQYFNGKTQENLGQNEQNNIVSVREYFRQSSHGLFTPEFTVVGPVDLPQTQEYYGHNAYNDKGEQTATDPNFSQFCKDAIAAVDEQVNFKDYDNAGDGNAELVCIIYAGYGESVSGNGSETIWPKCGYRGYQTADGVKVSYFNCSPELYRKSKGTDINGIGLFCHEFSHSMGLPDLYATNTSARIDNQTPEFWSVMDYGEYSNNGYAPVPYSAWEQQVMGWTELEELTESQTIEGMTPLLKGGKAYRLGNSANNEECFILENAQVYNYSQHQLGSYRGHGLVVWHIAYSSANVNMGDYPNNTPQQPRVCIVPADGLVINGYRFVSNSTTPTNEKPYTQNQYVTSLQGDPFPGTSEVTQLNVEMQLPNYKFYNGEATPVFKIKNVTEDTSVGTVSFEFDNGHTPSGIQNVQRSSVSAQRYFDLQGRSLNGVPAQRGLYIRNNKKIVVR